MINQSTNEIILVYTQESQQNLSLVFCPTSQQSVSLKQDRNPIDIPDGQAIWWHCPICEGWHISIRNLFYNNVTCT